MLNPFCKAPKPIVQPALNDRLVIRSEGVDVDKDTLSFVPKYASVDLQAEIEKCRDLAGVDNMKRLLATGEAVPEDFYDDGKHGVDNTVLPVDQHEAARQADKLSEQAAALAQELGVGEGEKISADQFEKLMTQYIKDHADRFVQPAKEVTSNE